MVYGVCIGVGVNILWLILFGILVFVYWWDKVFVMYKGWGVGCSNIMMYCR